MPFLGAADTVWVSATYTDGAVGYINAGQSDPIGPPAGGNGVIDAGPLGLPFADAFVDPFTGDFKTNKAYGIAGGLNHYWTSEWRTNVFGSWMRFDAPGLARFLVPVNAATVAAGTAGTATGFVDFNEYRVGGNVMWSPVTGFIIAVEALYTRVDPQGRVAVPLTNVAGVTMGRSSRRAPTTAGKDACASSATSESLSHRGACWPQISIIAFALCTPTCSPPR